MSNDGSWPARVVSVGETHASDALGALADCAYRQVETPSAALAVADSEPVGCFVCAPDDADWDPVGFVERVRDRDADVAVVLATDGPLDAYVDAGVVGPLADVVRSGEADALVGAVERAVAAVRERAADREASGRYRSLVEESQAPVAVLDAAGRCRLANDALASLLGVAAPADIVGRHAREFVASDALETTWERLRRVVDEREATPAVQRTLVDADGEQRYALAAMQPVVFEGDPAAQVVLTDVTEHKRLQSALRAQRDRFSTLFEHLSEPVVATEFTGDEPVVTDVNQSFAETFGVDAAAAAGRPLDDLIVPTEDREVAASFNRRAKTGERLDVEVRRETPDGPRDFLLRFVPYGATGPRGGYAIYIDVTERREWERQLRRQNERLEEVARVVSHDLRNPLNVAAGTVDALAERASESEREHFARVRRAHDRIEAIISDMLALARQGQSVSDLVPVALDAVAADAWATVETGDATLDVETDATVMADASRLQQAFENLFANAVAHGGDDGVAVSVGESGDRGFFVADDGVGIPPEERDRVLESGFSTADDSTGFGLSIVQSIVEAHGWDVTVTDRAGGASGARFEITGVEFDGGAEPGDGEASDRA